MVLVLSQSIVHSSANPAVRSQVVTPLPSWKTITLVTIGACIAILGLFWQTAGSFVSVWARSTTFAHGFVILPLCLSLVWSRRHRITPLVPSPNLVGCLLLALIGFSWLVGHLADIIVV